MFEPHPESFKRLKHNTGIAKYKNVIAVQEAITDKVGEIEFFGMNVPAKHSVYDTSKDNPDILVEKKITVRRTTIDNFLTENNNPEIDFIKMDIEGSELKALAGMRRLMSRAEKMAMVVEFNVGNLEKAGESPLNFLRQLQLMFNVKAILRNGKLANVDDFVWHLAKEGYVNLLCLKNMTL